MTHSSHFQHALKAVARTAFMSAFVFAGSFLTSCDDDDEKGFPSVAGKWTGDKTELNVKFEGIPTPINETDDSFAGKVEFKSNGTAVYEEDGDVLTGTWFQNGDQLTLTIPDDSEDIDMSGTYTIKELKGSKLKLYIEKEASIEDPDTGIVLDAAIKATLYFNKN